MTNERSDARSSRLEELVAALGPSSILDVGCGCGRHLTCRLARHAARVVAIDVAGYGDRWREIAAASAVRFCRMDARALGFAAGAYPLVLQRAALHHIADWPAAVAEMIRVSSDHVLLEEPVDDPRSPAKRRTEEAQDLLLRLQAEAGIAHYRHLRLEDLLSAVRRGARVLEVHLERSDAPVAFDEFFDSYPDLAARTARADYWLREVDRLRARFDGAPLREDDTLTVLAVKSEGTARPAAEGEAP